MPFNTMPPKLDWMLELSTNNHELKHILNQKFSYTAVTTYMTICTEVNISQYFFDRIYECFFDKKKTSANSSKIRDFFSDICILVAYTRKRS